MADERVRSLAEAEQHIRSLTARIAELERKVSDHAQRFDTLQSPMWKRVVFRIDGWPGQNDLNAEGRAWRPWH
jgi:chaperonin cofactor prefoldin